MSRTIPGSKLSRGLAGGKAAAKVGGDMLQYYAARPFLSPKGRERALKRLDDKTARTIFNCLSMLKGTALKVAQVLSLELELLPPAVARELQKSYNQVPPINRVLARKAITSSLGNPPEKVFKHFNGAAFAAASLGQVHEAMSPDGKKLAVKLQYPGIKKTIKSDLQLLRGALRSVSEYKIVKPAIEEIEERLLEEVDYINEANNMAFFNEHLNLEGVNVPRPWRPGSSKTVLSASYMEGLPLNLWLKTGPGQQDIDLVAKRLNDIFLHGLYELNCIHADPNPGNFIIAEDMSVGLIDFGCVKKLQPGLVKLYRRFPDILINGDKQEYFDMLEALEIIRPGLDEKTADDIYNQAYDFGQWLAQIYTAKVFDFGAAGEFMVVGKKRMQAMYKYRRHLAVNPQIIYLDRTRYGFLRVFQKMGARVNMRNSYEWDT
jgi:predicted unusual protein kinase regulating ubiquinone biosynthesis (AarF/ABC1/UbiB family)